MTRRGFDAKWLLLAMLPLMGFGWWGCPYGTIDDFVPPMPDSSETTAPPATGFQIAPMLLTKIHPAGFAPCPDNFEMINITGPEGGQWFISNLDDMPGWLNFDKTSGSFPDTVQPSFPCQGYQHQQSWSAQFSDGTNVQDIKIELQVDY